MLDLESEVMRGLGSIPTGGNILSLDFFSHSKASDVNIIIIVNFCLFVKNLTVAVSGPVLWLISTNTDRLGFGLKFGLRFGLGLGLLFRWLHCTMQNFFPLVRIPVWRVSRMVTVPVLGKDLHPYSIHLNQGIRVRIQTSVKTDIVQESVSEFKSESESGSGNKPLLYND